MRRIIRDTKSGKFYAQGEWVEDFRQAQEFSTTVAVISFCSERKLQNVEMVLQFGELLNPQFDISLPLGPGSGL